MISNAPVDHRANPPCGATANKRYLMVTQRVDACYHLPFSRTRSI